MFDQICLSSEAEVLCKLVFKKDLVILTITPVLQQKQKQERG
jgi:hypothetical protein